MHASNYIKQSPCLRPRADTFFYLMGFLWLLSCFVPVDSYSVVIPSLQFILLAVLIEVYGFFLVIPLLSTVFLLMIAALLFACEGSLFSYLFLTREFSQSGHAVVLNNRLALFIYAFAIAKSWAIFFSSGYIFHLLKRYAWSAPLYIRVIVAIMLGRLIDLAMQVLFNIVIADLIASKSLHLAMLSEKQIVLICIQGVFYAIFSIPALYLLCGMIGMIRRRR